MTCLYIYKFTQQGLRLVSDDCMADDDESVASSQPLTMSAAELSRAISEGVKAALMNPETLQSLATALTPLLCTPVRAVGRPALDNHDSELTAMRAVATRRVLQHMYSVSVCASKICSDYVLILLHFTVLLEPCRSHGHRECLHHPRRRRTGEVLRSGEESRVKTSKANSLQPCKRYFYCCQIDLSCLVS